MRTEVAIVGAGIVGCAVAYELGRRGLGCTLIDDRPPGGGATQASAGMLAPYVEAHEHAAFLDLSVRSLTLYDDWIAAIRRDSGLDVEYRRIGTLEIALDASHARDLQARAAPPGPIAMEWFDAAHLKETYPFLAAASGALHVPTHGYVSPPGLTAALLYSALRHGAAVMDARVSQIDATPDAVTLTTSRGRLDAGHVVLAAGAWLNAIETRTLSLAPIRPVRGQILHLGWGGPPIETILWGPECYIVPRTDGTILVGATVEDVGFDERATAAGVRDLLDAACELLPAAWGATFLGVRVGLRPAAPDDLPVLGPDPSSARIVHAYGHYRNGVLLSPITAALVAGWIAEGSRDPLLDAFSAQRFRY